MLLFASTAFLLGAATSCGKRQPPQPPSEKIRQRVEISAVQRGSSIQLKWRMPSGSAGAGSLVGIERADIYRLATPAGRNDSISEEDFAADSTLIASETVDEKDLGKEFVFNDPLNLAGQPVTLRYAVRLVNRSGQKAVFSNFAVVDPAAKVAEAPGAPSLAVAQNAVTVSWVRPLKNIDGSAPASIIGFNIYRTVQAKSETKLLNPTPVSDESFADGEFEFGIGYSYFVRAVSLGADGNPIESIESQSVAITPKDVFPPIAPESLTIAASPKTVSIFFASNLEKDLGGYKIYRSTDPDLPFDKWTLLTEKPIQTNTYQDEDVESGKTYHYFIIAIDRSGNVSERSQTVSETVP